MSNHEFTNWTALPNHIVGDTLRLSVFVTPRLLGEAGRPMSLSDFKAILDWPQTIADLKIRVEAIADGGAAVGEPMTFTPVNQGELGVDGDLWKTLFHGDMLVEPFSVDPAPAAQAAPRRSVPVFYRAAPLQALVEESYAIYARLALSGLEAEPKRPHVGDGPARFDSPDALLGLAGGVTPALTAQQFALKEGNSAVYRPATTVTDFFDEERVQAAASPLAARMGEPLSADHVRELFNAFSLYHKRGIRNRSHQIRGRRRWTSTDPNFNFLSSETFQVSNSDHGKEFEFAESVVPVLLPRLTGSDRGFEITVAYSPNEAMPAPSNDQHEPERTWREKDERIDRYAEHLTVTASGGATFAHGGTTVTIAAQRAKKVIWDGTRWEVLDRNQMDFHSILSGLTSFPSLMRRLGWVFDLEMPVKAMFPDFAPGMQLTGKVRAVPVWGPTGSPPSVSSPWTLFAAGERQGEFAGRALISFSARVDPARVTEPLRAGFRDLTPAGSFHYDLDAAVIKTVQKAVREADQCDRYMPSYRIEVPGSPRAAVLNSLAEDAGNALETAIDIDPQYRAAGIRSTGISVYADREYANFAGALKADASRTTNFTGRLRTALSAANAEAQTVDGEDVHLNDITAGYIIDAHDSSTSQWHSLCERQVVFKFETGRADYLAPADEGWISAEALVEKDEVGNSQLRINENFFRWDGWSLVAPHPSEKLKECGSPDSEDPLPTNIGLTPIIEPRPLSLARLRFGRTYRFRARLADLAGNAWPREYADHLDAECESSKPTTYRRYDPINPPFLVPLQPPGPGTPAQAPEQGEPTTSKGPEKGEMLVIRSGVGAKYRTGEWLVLPPEVKFQEAEWMGMFDAFESPDKAYSILERYCGALPAAFDPDFLPRVTWSGEKLATPYLPDGHAAGAAFSYLPGGTERQPEAAPATVNISANLAVSSTTSVDFRLDLEGPQKSGTPFSQPFHLRLSAGDKRKTEMKGRRLSVTLPPGEQQLVRVSSVPVENPDLFAQVHGAFSADQEKFVIQPRDGDQLGNANWNAMKGFATSLHAAISLGQFWPLTPKKNIYLVHAVPKPVVPPAKEPDKQSVFEFSDNAKVAPRVTGGFATVLHDPDLRVHRTSTSRIDVYASWDEHNDGQGYLEFPQKERRRHSCFSYDIDLPDLTIAPDESHFTVDFARRHEFPTTKHYAVKYQMIATTRYREYYDPIFTADPANITITSEESKVFHILNTTPPPALELVYVLPVLIWEDPVVVPNSGADGGQRIERKIRRGLRVYMRRNWFQSGEDEMLAAVFAPDGASPAMALDADPEHQLPVTQWGTNPIWLTKPLDRQPTVQDAIVETGLICRNVKIAKKGTMAALATIRDVAAPASVEDDRSAAATQRKMRQADQQIELPPEEVDKVDVAAFRVHCDHDKDLVYADVEFAETGSYSPMVKLALARFQPFSAPYAHLSTITSWVFQAISPERVIAYGVVLEMNEDAAQPTKQVRFTIGGTAPGNSKLGYLENSLSILLFDGETQISEWQVPHKTADVALGFSVPLGFLEPLKRPIVQITEYEYVRGQEPRVAFVYRTEIDLEALGGR
jgi:hypothetical protein